MASQRWELKIDQNGTSRVRNISKEILKSPKNCKPRRALSLFVAVIEAQNDYDVNTLRIRHANKMLRELTRIIR